MGNKIWKTCNRSNCCNYEGRHCEALKAESKIDTRICPFYKSIARNDREKEECEERLRRLGMLDKYREYYSANEEYIANGRDDLAWMREIISGLK